MSDISILYFKRAHFPGERTKVVATFHATVGGFKIRGGSLRENEDGERFASCAARGNGITLMPGPVRDELTAELVRLYDQGEEFDVRT